MKKFIYFIFLALLFTSCSSRGYIGQLDEVDSLVTHEQYDSANLVLTKIDTSLLKDAGTKARYYLLQTQLTCILQKKDSINMLDSIVIPYYIKIGNKDKLAKAYYYKAYKEICDGHIPESVTFYKLAEENVNSTTDNQLHYKIAESLSYANEIIGNYQFQLDYALKSARLALSINNKRWLASSYINIALAHSNLDHIDSSLFYINKASYLKEYVPDTDKLGFLIDISFFYKYSQPQKAKKYLIESLSMKETSCALEHLADINYHEGNQEEAYRLWKKALTIDDNNPKDNILHNLLEYDVEHGKTDSICHHVNEIIAIKDSIINNLKNDTIKDLQLRFDHEVAMRKQETITNNWQKGLLAAILFISLLIAYIIIKRYREKTRMQEAQMQINNLVGQIHELEESEKDNSVAIQKLNDQIKDTMDKEGPLLKQGKMLYDQIKGGQTVIEWRKKDFELFINYYKAIDFKTVSRLEKTKRKEKLTPHKMFFLLLNEMGYDKKEIIRILGISETSVNTLYFRTKPIE